MTDKPHSKGSLVNERQNKEKIRKLQAKANSIQKYLIHYSTKSQLCKGSLFLIRDRVGTVQCYLARHYVMPVLIPLVHYRGVWSKIVHVIT